MARLWMRLCQLAVATCAAVVALPAVAQDSAEQPASASAPATLPNSDPQPATAERLPAVDAPGTQPADEPATLQGTSVLPEPQPAVSEPSKTNTPAEGMENGWGDPPDSSQPAPGTPTTHVRGSRTPERGRLQDGLALLRMVAATTASGMLGVVPGVVLAGLLTVAVVGPIALVVRNQPLSPALSAAGIAAFLVIPPVLMGLGVTAGYAAGRMVAPWLAALLANVGTVPPWTLKYVAAFVLLDVAAHVVLLTPAALLTLVVGTATAAAGYGQRSDYQVYSPTRRQVAFYTGLAYAGAVLLVTLPPLLVLAHGAVPLASLLAVSGEDS